MKNQLLAFSQWTASKLALPEKAIPLFLSRFKNPQWNLKTSFRILTTDWRQLCIKNTGKNNILLTFKEKKHNTFWHVIRLVNLTEPGPSSWIFVDSRKRNMPFKLSTSSLGSWCADFIKAKGHKPWFHDTLNLAFGSYYCIKMAQWNDARYWNGLEPPCWFKICSKSCEFLLEDFN